jgi:ribosomal protein L12E/L44/L45/RPP1/RPP2
MTPGITGYMEDAKIYIENKEDIPDSIIMKIVKSKLLHIKTNEIEKIQNQLDKKDVKDAKKGKTDTGGAAAAAAGGKKTPTKDKKKGGPGPLPEIEKQKLLKKRDEIEEDEKFIGKSIIIKYFK